MHSARNVFYGSFYQKHVWAVMHTFNSSHFLIANMLHAHGEAVQDSCNQRCTKHVQTSGSKVPISILTVFMQTSTLTAFPSTGKEKKSSPNGIDHNDI
jgi:hypothetical protein